MVASYSGGGGASPFSIGDNLIISSSAAADAAHFNAPDPNTLMRIQVGGTSKLTLSPTAVTVPGTTEFDAFTINVGDVVSGPVVSANTQLNVGTPGAGTLAHKGDAAGFYNTTPIAKPTGVAVTAAGIHAALVALGLIGA